MVQKTNLRYALEGIFQYWPYYTYWLIRVSEISELNIHSIFCCLDTIGTRILFVTIPLHVYVHKLICIYTHRYYTKFNQLLIGMSNALACQLKIRKKMKTNVFLFESISECSCTLKTNRWNYFSISHTYHLKWKKK